MPAKTTRDFSPPDKTEIFFSTSSPENKNAPNKLRTLPRVACGTRDSISSSTVFLGSKTSNEF